MTLFNNVVFGDDKYTFKVIRDIKFSQGLLLISCGKNITKLLKVISFSPELISDKNGLYWFRDQNGLELEIFSN